jgi:hypothetical protein
MGNNFKPTKQQILLVLILILGIIAGVFIVQSSTLLRSRGYDLLDFVYTFSSREGDARFNPTLDINSDGVINVFDVLKDRYARLATESGQATDSASPIASSSAEITY